MRKKLMKRKNLAVLGAAGRMGQEIAELLRKSSSWKPALGVVNSGQALHFEKSIHSLSEKEFSKIDLILDFSSAKIFAANLQFAIDQRIPFVSGVTGISKENRRELEKAGKKIPVLWSANMSIGIAVLMEALRALKGVSDFDFQIEEIHHNQKKDRPSGTAIQLQEALEKAVSKKCPEPISIRAGGVFGVHKVFAISNNEVMTFEHTALNRKVFAEGALAAAQWVVKKQPGFYQMKDIFLS